MNLIPTRRLAPWLVALTTATGAVAAAAQPVELTLPTPSGVVNLNASASVDVAHDVLTIAWSTTREGPDAQSVQTALKQALDAALAEARKAARPDQVEVRTGNFALYPRYGTKPNTITGWQGSTELIVSGKDMPTIAALAGRITTMSIARVGQSLSREAKQKVEGEVMAAAVAQFRTQAAELAKQFGHAGYTMREVSVAVDQPGGAPVPLMRVKSMAAAAPMDESLPTEAGKGTITATVSGSVQLK